MLLFGHLGLGQELGRSLVSPRDLRWLLLGAVMPDLVDKPLYYSLALATGRHGADLGLFSGTRTIGHTLLLVLTLRLVFWRGPGVALAVGACSHLLLDLLGELVSWARCASSVCGQDAFAAGPSTLAAIFFPVLGPHFPIQPYTDLGEHLLASVSLWTVGSELLGGFLLWRRWHARAAPADPSAQPGEADQ